MPYTLLVEFSMLLSVPSILLFMWSFVALRIQRPFVDRPFLIPGGLPVAVLLTVVPVAISISYAAIITTESSFSFDQDTDERRSRSSDGGLPPIFQVFSMIIVMACGGLVHLVFVLRERWAPPRGTMRMPESVFANGGMAELTPLPPPLPSSSELLGAFAREGRHVTDEEELMRWHSNGGGDTRCSGGTSGRHPSASSGLSDTVRTVVSTLGASGRNGTCGPKYQQIDSEPP